MDKKEKDVVESDRPDTPLLSKAVDSKSETGKTTDSSRQNAGDDVTQDDVTDADVKASKDKGSVEDSLLPEVAFQKKAEDGKLHEMKERNRKEKRKRERKPAEQAEADKKKAAKVNIFRLFRFATPVDYVLMVIGILAACMHGTCVQLNFVILGDTVNIIIEQISQNTTSKDGDIEEIIDAVPWILTRFLLNATGILVCGFIHMSCWVYTADRQVRVIRRKAFNSVLRQHMGYFDKNKSGALVTCLTEDITRIQAGMGDKVASFVQWVSAFISGAIICLVTGPKLTIVLLCVAPIAAICGAVVAKILQKMAVKENEAYGLAGSVAEEVLSAIRIVAAYAGEEKEVKRYEKHLKGTRRIGLYKGLISGLGQGLVWFIAFAIIGLAFWYGGILVRGEGYNPGFVLQVQFAMFAGMRNLGWSAGAIEFISAARGAAVSVFKIIDTQSEIDSADETGTRPDKCDGEIVFKDVDFVYPTRTDVPVLKGFNLSIPKGKTVALVGPSGCGKSTTIQLLQRFYDPVKGGVAIDGTDVKDLNISWLRNQIGVVSQDPVLFATTIEENIRFGREDATLEEVKEAAMDANAHDFIMRLPEGYDTVLSELGTQLSRGEKQRISLARALIRKPAILLLDEATSALDQEAEAVVQDALDKNLAASKSETSQGRTTIIIAHRLSTVIKADTLYVIDQGVVAESGNHDELMAKDGLYAKLVFRQMESRDDQDEAGDRKRRREERDDLEARDDDTEPGIVVRAYSLHSLHDIEMEIGGDDTQAGKKAAKSMKGGSKLDHEASQPLMEQKDGSSEEPEEEEAPPPAMGRMYALNLPELPLLIIGSLSAILQGAIFPAIAILFSDVVAIFAIEDKEKQKEQINYYVLVIVVTGAVAALCTFLMVFIFAITGERLTYRVRMMAFAAMLKQEIGWFDEKRNQVGTLTSKLANEASRIKGGTGAALCAFVNATSTIIFSLIIGFYFGWKLALVVLAFLPVLTLVGLLQVRMMAVYAKGGQKAVEHGGKICAEAISKVPTVASLTKESFFEIKYNNHFDELFKGSVKKALKFGITWGLSQCVLFYSFGAAFSFGSYLVGKHDMKFEDVFRVFITICVGGMEIGRINAYAPDFAKAKIAASKLFALFDRKSLIDHTDTSGKALDQCSAHIQYSNVWFHYPTRSDTDILRNFSLEIKAGQYVAMVGPSGNGKTTALQLLERFYDHQRGQITVDNVSLQDLNIAWLRSQIGVVTQDPILFGVTIRENIAYGDNTREVTMEEVIASAKGANIHNFITSLPLGYETNVGSKGTQLSGGQKQRVSIARALVRNPKILILDDATSALDSESEKIVQEALKKAQTGRTSLVVAHRLSTIKDAHLICYMEDGGIVERGTHQELMDNEGYYYKLQQAFLGNREEC